MGFALGFAGFRWVNPPSWVNPAGLTHPAWPKSTERAWPKSTERDFRNVENPLDEISLKPQTQRKPTAHMQNVKNPPNQPQAYFPGSVDFPPKLKTVVLIFGFPDPPETQPSASKSTEPVSKSTGPA